jgi:hypothetical protein
MPRLAPAVVALAAGIGVLVGIAVLNKLARDDLDRRGYYDVVIGDLRVPAPPGLTREQFLDEVCYESRLPPRLNRTDPGAAERLRAAFAKHPWVEAAAVGDLASPHPVTLTFRRPTLAAGERVLDRTGTPMPLRTSADGLPVYSGPPEAAGAVAKTMGWLAEKAPELKWQAAEVTPDGLVFVRPDGARAVWGLSKPDEPPPDAKLGRLKEWNAGAIDLRKTR